MNRPPPPSFSSPPNGRLTPVHGGGSSKVSSAHGSFLRSLVQHSTIYCCLTLLIFNTLFVLVLLDSLSLLSVDAAILNDKSSYKPYLTRTNYDYDDDGNYGNEKWKRTGVRFLTKLKSPPSESYEDNNGIAGSDFHIIEFEAEKGTNEEYSGSPDEEGGNTEMLRIHLMRKSSVVHPKLQVVVVNENEKQIWNPPGNSSTSSTELNCHFVGHVTKHPNDTSKDKLFPNQEENGNKTGGIAIFSACPPSNGFNGLIIMEDGRQWYMEPSSETHHQSRRQRRDADSDDLETLEHVYLPHSQLGGHLAAHISDVLRVPLPQLEEAARLAAVDAEARRNVRHAIVGSATSRGWDDDDTSFESLQGESSILTPFFYSGATFPFFGRGNDHKVTHARKVASSRKSGSSSGGSSSAPTTLLTPLENGGGGGRRPSKTLTSTSTSTAATTSTTSRETAPVSVSSASIENLSGQSSRPLPRVVEISVFTDEELYNKMKSKFNQDTTSQLKEYATAMVNMMDVMYQHSTLGVDLRFRLVYLEVMKKKPTPLKTHGGKAKAYLSSFCDYAGEKNVNSAQWDHALLLTGIDLHEEGIKTTAGLAWAGTMCFRYYSCSISEGLNFASAYITTHEIGHSLGMEHDGVGISSSCDSTKYIMSPTTGPGKVTWSSCSSSNLQDFIKYGTSELRGQSGKGNFMISKPICLEELVSSRGKKSFELGEAKSGSGSGLTGGDGVLEAESDLKLPGEKYDANYQCSLGMGSFFKPHFERHKPPFDNICWILYCGNGTHAISTHPALEGTPCDRKKYCRAGHCVKRDQT